LVSVYEALKQSPFDADVSFVVSCRRWQMLLILAGLLVAGFLPTLALSRSEIHRGTGTTIMLVVTGQTTTMSSAALEKKVTTGLTADAARRATIIMVVNGRVVVNSPATSYRDFALNAARNAAVANKADNVPHGRYDPDRATSTTDSGYSGMTIALLGRNYDMKLPHEHLKLVRVSRTSYCVQSTVDGQTAFKNGPAAPLAFGHC
jgi:hypothetical protein